MHDVIVIGGSYAGMAAALQLARARRKVLVIDAGHRRNRFASHSHGFLGRTVLILPGSGQMPARSLMSIRPCTGSRAMQMRSQAGKGSSRS